MVKEEAEQMQAHTAGVNGLQHSQGGRDGMCPKSGGRLIHRGATLGMS